jgi:CRISPR-associated protein Cas1
MVLEGGRVKWDTLIGLKVEEFARFPVGKSEGFDLKFPAPLLERSDTRDLRGRILSLSAVEARRLSLGKSAFHYLKKHARDRKPFKIYKKVSDKLELDRDCLV